MSVCVFFLYIKITDDEDQQAQNAFKILVSITDKSGNLRKDLSLCVYVCAYVCVCVYVSLYVFIFFYISRWLTMKTSKQRMHSTY